MLIEMAALLKQKFNLNRPFSKTTYAQYVVTLFQVSHQFFLLLWWLWQVTIPCMDTDREGGTCNHFKYSFHERDDYGNISICCYYCSLITHLFMVHFQRTNARNIIQRRENEEVSFNIWILSLNINLPTIQHHLQENTPHYHHHHN